MSTKLCIAAVSAAALCASSALAAEASSPVSAPEVSRRPLTQFERLTDLAPERVVAFRRTLAEFSGAEPASKLPGLHFEAQYETEQFRLRPEAAPRMFSEDDGIILPPGLAGRDLWAEEEFLIQGREDDFQDAAEKWMSRKLKGSDSAAQRRGGRMAPKFGWDGGPLAGFRRGPYSVLAGEDQWNFRWTHRMARPGWVARIGCGVEDGEERVAFSIGRSLFHARTAR